MKIPVFLMMFNTFGNSLQEIACCVNLFLHRARHIPYAGNKKEESIVWKIKNSHFIPRYL